MNETTNDVFFDEDDQETTPTSPVTIEQLENKSKELREISTKYDELKLAITKLDEEYAKVEKELMGLLDAADISSYKSKYGHVIISDITSVTVPKGDEKQKFFEYLKAQDIYDEVVTVNAKWLTSYYKQEKQAALDNGNPFFEMPGVAKPFVKPRLSFKKV